MNKVLGFGVMILVSALPAWGQCPSADYTRDCFVDLADFAVLAGHWLNGDPNMGAEGLTVMARQWMTGNRLPSDMIIIPAGTFRMGNCVDGGNGSPDEYPVHIVTVDSFAMGQYEITNGQYCAFLNSRYPANLKVVDGVVYGLGDTMNQFPYCDTANINEFSQIYLSNNAFMVRSKGSRDMSNDPMVRVSWYGAVAYCNWRSTQEGRTRCYTLSTWTCDYTQNGYRLPTEAEWEYAARGGLEGKRFPWGDTISHSQANYLAGSGDFDVSPTTGFHPLWNDGIRPYTAPVGSFAANGFGLFDTTGNVNEWCNDWYESYSKGSQTNPTGPATGTAQSRRGGGWEYSGLLSIVSYRHPSGPDYRSYNGGFRVVLKP